MFVLSNIVRLKHKELDDDVAGGDATWSAFQYRHTQKNKKTLPIAEIVAHSKSDSFSYTN